MRCRKTPFPIKGNIVGFALKEIYFLEFCLVAYLFFQLAVPWSRSIYIWTFKRKSGDRSYQWNHILDGLVHLASLTEHPPWFQGASRGQQKSEFCSVSWLSHSPFMDGWPCGRPSSPPSVDTWVVSTLELLWILLLWVWGWWKYCRTGNGWWLHDTIHELMPLGDTLQSYYNGQFFCYVHWKWGNGEHWHFRR